MASDDVQEDVQIQQGDEAQAIFEYAAGRPLMVGNLPLTTQDFEKQQREHYLLKCISTLQTAAEIRQNEALMTEIRALLRRKKDEMTIMLDEIGCG